MGEAMPSISTDHSRNRPNSQAGSPAFNSDLEPLFSLPFGLFLRPLHHSSSANSTSTSPFSIEGTSCRLRASRLFSLFSVYGRKRERRSSLSLYGGFVFLSSRGPSLIFLPVSLSLGSPLTPFAISPLPSSPLPPHPCRSTLLAWTTGQLNPLLTFPPCPPGAPRCARKKWATK